MEELYKKENVEKIAKEVIEAMEEDKGVKQFQEMIESIKKIHESLENIHEVLKTINSNLYATIK